MENLFHIASIPCILLVIEIQDVDHILSGNQQSLTIYEPLHLEVDCSVWDNFLIGQLDGGHELDCALLLVKFVDIGLAICS